MLKNQKYTYPIITFGALVGFIASFLQMLEKITLLKNAHSVLSCNLDSVFNCSNILNAHQSSVFGFPNSLLCMTFFAVMATAGLIGWTGGKISPRVRLGLQGIALFIVGFGFWYFWQSIFNIGSVCLYCIFCFSGVLLINWGWLRQNYSSYGKFTPKLKLLIDSGADIFFWCLIALLIVLEGLIKFK